ncbi:hypothetical protein ACFY2H_37585 [Streptomyces griseofuscus]|uniref:hypothetical protein n=1 Tax=Streptomyces griseofuscus TaxID=146922 RepID=UPI0036A2C3B8
MEIATIRRDLNHTLTELGRAVDKLAVAQAADLYALAWQQAAQAPPSETRQQRARLAEYKEILSSRRWQEEERRQAADRSTQPVPVPVPVPEQEPRTVRRPRPVAEPAPVRPAVVWSSDKMPQQFRPPSPGPRRPPAARTGPAPVVFRRSAPGPEPALLDSGALWEIATQLRSHLEQVARAGATTTWPTIRKRLPGLPRLHRDDESVVLWLVDEERRDDEPLLASLVTVGDRQMHPRFPAIAEQLGLGTGRTPAQQRSAWGYEVLRAHQYWRHRR